MLRFSLNRQLPTVIPSLLESNANMLRMRELLPVMPMPRFQDENTKKFLDDTEISSGGGGSFAFSTISTTSYGANGEKRTTVSRRYKDASGRDKSETLRTLHDGSLSTMHTRQDGEKTEMEFEGVENENEFDQKWRRELDDPTPDETRTLWDACSEGGEPSAEKTNTKAAEADDVLDLRRRASALRRLKESRQLEAAAEAERQRLRAEIAELESELQLNV